MNDTFLSPIEKPQGLMMKLAYYFTRRQFGKVLTPLKVHSARLPPAFGLFYTRIGKLDKKLLLPPETALLIREQVARTNVCLFCMDIGRSFTIKASMNEAKFDALDEYNTIIIISHDIESSLAISDTAFILSQEKGKEGATIISQFMSELLYVLSIDIHHIQIKITISGRGENNFISLRRNGCSVLRYNRISDKERSDHNLNCDVTVFVHLRFPSRRSRFCRYCYR